MKKKLLLIASLTIGVCAQAQFAESNAPAIGAKNELFALDTLAPSYEGTTGSGVIWDYSTTLGVPNETRNIEIFTASAVDTDGNFGSSDKAQVLESLLTTFYTDDAAGRVSQGIIFNDPTIGNLVATFEVDEEQLYTYPFDIGSSFDDTFEGTYFVEVLGTPLSGAVEGKIHAEVDGKGTLKLANTDYTNVLRYKIMDTVNVLGTPLGNVTMIRLQYEYYDHTTSFLPILIYSKVVLSQVSPATTLSTQTMLLSYDETTDFVGLTTNVMEGTSVYPNPTEGVLNIQLPSSVQSANIDITDALGRRVLNSTMESAMKSLDVSSLNKGVYFVSISDGTQSSTKRIVIK